MLYIRRAFGSLVLLLTLIHTALLLHLTLKTVKQRKKIISIYYSYIVWIFRTVSSISRCWLLSLIISCSSNKLTLFAKESIMRLSLFNVGVVVVDRDKSLPLIFTSMLKFSSLVLCLPPFTSTGSTCIRIAVCWQDGAPVWYFNFLP